MFLKKSLSIKTYSLYFKFFKIFFNKNFYHHFNQTLNTILRQFLSITHYSLSKHFNLFFFRSSFVFIKQISSPFNINCTVKFYSKDRYNLIQQNFKNLNFNLINKSFLGVTTRSKQFSTFFRNSI
jgi:hypothetical protein